MIRNNTSSTNLRDRAEQWLRLSHQDIANMPTKDVQELVYELQVHQVELQMQNEELHQTQVELEILFNKYYDLYNFAPTGYLTLDTNGCILEANNIAAEQLNMKHHELIGKKFSCFIVPDSQDIFHLHNRKVLVSDEPQQCEIRLKPQEADVQMHSVRVAGTHSYHYRTAITNINELKKLERDLTQTRNQADKANQAKSRFLANMNHEIRTPLNVIIGLCYLLKQSKPLTEAQQEQLDLMRTSSSSLLSLVNELLDIAKIEANSIQFEYINFDLAAMLKEVLGMLKVKADEKNIQLIEKNFITHTVFWGDCLRIRQIVTNLLDNAIKFTSKGEVTLHVETVYKEKDWITLILSVSDTGIGIPKEKQARIFDIFMQADASMTRKYGGSGLGLTICKYLTEQMDGSINVISTEGKGSTFTVHLPLQLSHEEIIHPNNSEKIIPYPISDRDDKATILLVEDHAPNVLIITTFLKNFSYNYDVATNGKQAVDLSKQHAYKLILMDVQMQGMDGLDATRHIREREKQKKLPPTPIIAMTAHSFSEDKEKCLQAGMTDYISKPFNLDELQQKIEKFMRVNTA